MKLIETREEFRSWCKRVGYTKEELAELLGVTRQTIYNWMEGKQKNPIKGPESEETKLMGAQYDRVPQMLTLSVFALEQLGRDYFLKGGAMRKRVRRG